jgi:hypothetical protein
MPFPIVVGFFPDSNKKDKNERDDISGEEAWREIK